MKKIHIFQRLPGRDKTALQAALFEIIFEWSNYKSSDTIVLGDIRPREYSLQCLRILFRTLKQCIRGNASVCLEMEGALIAIVDLL